MNQGNNITGYDSQPGYTQQPIQAKPPKKSNTIFIIIAILIVIGIAISVLYLNNQNKEKPTNNETPNESEVKNNHQSSYSIGIVEEGTNTTYDESGAFLFNIEDVFIITKRIVATGKVMRGKLKVGDKVQIIGLNEEILTREVTGIQKYKDQIDEATVGDNVEITLKDITREQLQRGQVLAKPNSIVASTKFDADVHMLSTKEGGAHNTFPDEYKPDFNFREVDIPGAIKLLNGIEKLNPGDDVSITTTLVNNVAMEVGTEFLIREGGRTLGRGTVTKVY